MGTLKKGSLLDCQISDLAIGGEGLSRIDGLVVFVDQTVPGDVVQARIFKKKKNYARARVVAMLEPSPIRVEAPCVYNGYCGGCKWQFLNYKQQLIYKGRHVQEALTHIGLLQDVLVHPVLGSQNIFAYRNKMEFSCSDRRWLLPSEMQSEQTYNLNAVGLHVPGAFHKVLDLDQCLLQPARGNQILQDVSAYIKASPAPIYGLRSHQGFWRYLMLRHSVSCDQWMVNIITATEDREIVQPLADWLTRQYPQITSVINNITARKAGIAVGEYEILLAGKPSLIDMIGPYSFEISANSFFQTNTHGAQILFEVIKKFAGLNGDETVLDLYSGTGAIAIYLAAQAKKVMGMEICASAVADAQKNCQLNHINNCTFRQGDIKDLLKNDSADVIIIDPPRSGLHQKVVKKIIALNPPRMVYVSCNPTTLARDLGLFKDYYDIKEIQPVDMFPHTYHIEAVARLERTCA